MNAVDTNVLVRLLARDDARQVERAENFVATGAWVSHLVLAETIWVLDSVYKLGRKSIVIAVQMLLDHALIALQEPAVVGAALEHFRNGRSIDFSDCLILEIARGAGHKPLGTFDRALGNLENTQSL